MFERDKLDPADSMRIERNIYFEEQTADLSGLTALPLEQLQALREEYAAAEQAAFEALQEQAAAWDEQAGKTLAISYSLLCKWFRAAVLPADRLLYAELYQTGDKKKCTECGAFFASTSNSVKYCPVCRKRITRRQAAERMRKRRAPVTQ